MGEIETPPQPPEKPDVPPTHEPPVQPPIELPPGSQTRTLRIIGTIPPEIWNRLGTKIIPKLKSGSDLKIGVDFPVVLDVGNAKIFESDLRQVLQDLGLADKVRIE